MERVIYRGHTGSHPIEVMDEGPLRSLRFGAEERQSCIDLNAPHELQLAYTRWMMTALLFHSDPKKFLLCGLGGGSIAHFLLHHHPKACLDIVEKEKRVIHVAKKFFHLPRTNRLHLYQNDIIDFLCSPSSPSFFYQIAFIDIFGPRSMAPPLFIPDFYRSILDRLEPNGIMAVNLWNGDKHLYGLACQAIRESCNNQMLEMAVKKRSNAILLAFPGELPKKTLRKARKHVAQHQQHYHLPFHRYLKKLRRTNKITLFA